MLAGIRRAEERELQRCARFVRATTRKNDGAVYYVMVGAYERAGENGDVYLYNEDKTPIEVMRGRYKGSQKFLPKKQLFVEYYDRHPEEAQDE